MSDLVAGNAKSKHGAGNVFEIIRKVLASHARLVDPLDRSGGQGLRSPRRTAGRTISLSLTTAGADEPKSHFDLAACFSSESPRRHLRVFPTRHAGFPGRAIEAYPTGWPVRGSHWHCDPLRSGRSKRPPFHADRRSGRFVGTPIGPNACSVNRDRWSAAGERRVPLCRKSRRAPHRTPLSAMSFRKPMQPTVRVGSTCKARIASMSRKRVMVNHVPSAGRQFLGGLQDRSDGDRPRQLSIGLHRGRASASRRGQPWRARRDRRRASPLHIGCGNRRVWRR